MKDGWNRASEKDSNVVLQVALEGETNRPNQHKSTMTIHITACQEEEPTVEPSPTIEPTKPAIPTPSPRLAPDYCTGSQELDHPTGMRLAQKHPGIIVRRNHGMVLQWLWVWRNRPGLYTC
jgi:hypothetical protein